MYTRFDAPWVVPRLLPPSLDVEAARGVRIVTPTARAPCGSQVFASAAPARAPTGRHARRVLRRILRRHAAQGDLEPTRMRSRGILSR